MRILISLILFSFVAHADTKEAQLANKVIAKTIVTLPKSTSAKQSQKAIQQTRNWLDKEGVTLVSKSGKIVYAYGMSTPHIVCKTLHSTDIELEEGEEVLHASLGDNVRWQLTMAKSGSGSSSRLHFQIKPSEANLETSFTVSTTRRVYHIILSSHKTDWMMYVGFSYPKKLEILKLYNQKVAHQQAEDTSIDGVALEDLDFNYEVKGEASWTPTRIFNDGARTFFYLPKIISATEAPVLMAMAGDGSHKVINYRVKGSRYIADSLAKKFIFLAGVGDDQEKIIIERSKAAVK
jgi:type IV secretion system protein TrbG